MQFTLTKKFALPFGLLLLLMAMMAFTTFLGQGIDTRSIEKVRNESTKHIGVGKVRLHFASLLMAVNDYIITGNREYNAVYNQQRDSLYRHLNELQSTVLTVVERTQLDTLRINIRFVELYADSIFHSNIVPSEKRTAKLMEEMDYRYGEQVSTQLTNLYESITNTVHSVTDEMQESDKREFWYVLIPFLVAFPIAVTVVVLTIKRISLPLRRLVRMAERITSRDFSSRLKVETKDEIGVLILAFNAMADEINRRYDELESFAYIVAHDLKNPICGIRGFTEITLETAQEKLTTEEKDSLRMVLHASDTMVMLINDLLDFARAGKIEISPIPVSINKILDDVQLDMLLYIRERNATIIVQENLPSVKCDPVRFSQIWKNLISNAIKYNVDPNPRVEITCREVCDDSTQLKFYHLLVTDNGIGLEEKDFERIFQPFKRAATTGEYEGTGIGLAIVKRVVNFHGGKVWVSSKVGEGTTFHFTIPKSSEYSA